MLQDAEPSVTDSSIALLIEASSFTLTAEEATKYLTRAKGDVGRALNAFLDAQTSDSKPKTSTAAAPSQQQQPSKPSAAATTKSSKPATTTTTAAAKASKKRKSDVNQRAITTFFTSPNKKNQKTSTPASAVDLKTEERDDEAAALQTVIEQQRQQQQHQQTTVPEEEDNDVVDLTEEEPAAPPQQQQQQPPSPRTDHITKQSHPQHIPTTQHQTPPPPPKDAVLLSIHQYHPTLHAPYTSTQQQQPSTPYLHIARALSAIDSTTKRLLITDALINTFRTILALHPEDLVSAVYLMMGTVGPRHENIQLGVGGSSVATAVVEVCGVSRGKLSELYKVYGDLGDVADACKRTQKLLIQPEPLTVPHVMSTLRSLATIQGQGANIKKVKTVATLLRACRESETKYLVRTLVQALRVGASETSIVSALGRAIAIHKHQLQQQLDNNSTSITSTKAAVNNNTNDNGGGSSGNKEKKNNAASSCSSSSIPSKSELDEAAAAFTTAFHTCPDIQLLTHAALRNPIQDLPIHCTAVPGLPVRPMLARISEGVDSAVSLLKGAPFIAERKYDGVRAQIHLVGGATTTKTSTTTGTTTTTNNSTTTTKSDKVFSRSSEDCTKQYLDVLSILRSAVGTDTTSGIVDAEIVAVERDVEDNIVRLRPFQELMTRGKGGGGGSSAAAGNVNKIDFGGGGKKIKAVVVDDDDEFNILPLEDKIGAVIAVEEEKMKEGVDIVKEKDKATITTRGPEICVFVFDILHLNGQNLMDCSLRDRRAQLAKVLTGVRPGYIQLAEGHIYDGNFPTEGLEQQIEQQMLAAFEAGTEGLMLKSLEGKYEPSKRSDSWVKLKKDYCQDLHETLDLVVIGAWHGNGRKVKWYSPFLLAAYDPDTESFQSVCRCMSGFSDEFYVAATARLKESIIPSPKPYYCTNEQPDVWFDCKEVWEIRGADLTLSAVHTAGIGRIDTTISTCGTASGTKGTASNRGISLRFPRFVRVREDKRVEDATTSEMVAEMYRQQIRKV